MSKTKPNLNVVTKGVVYDYSPEPKAESMVAVFDDVQARKVSDDKIAREFFSDFLKKGKRIRFKPPVLTGLDARRLINAQVWPKDQKPTWFGALRHYLNSDTYKMVEKAHEEGRKLEFYFVPAPDAKMLNIIIDELAKPVEERKIYAPHSLLMFYIAEKFLKKTIRKRKAALTSLRGLFPARIPLPGFLFVRLKSRFQRKFNLFIDDKEKAYQPQVFDDAKQVYTLFSPN